jgi:hypothetical protein
MSQPLRKLPDPLDDAPRLRRNVAGDPLSELMPRIVVVDDLEHADEAEQAGGLAPDAPREGERRGFQIPASFWWVMVGCYAVFIAALLAATGSSAHAVFMIVISTVYVVMFFGATRLLTREGPAQPRSPLARSGRLLAHALRPAATPRSGGADAGRAAGHRLLRCGDPAHPPGRHVTGGLAAAAPSRGAPSVRQPKDHPAEHRRQRRFSRFS